MDLKKYAARMLEQVEDRTMPLGNETGMTDEDRETLGRWGSALVVLLSRTCGERSGEGSFQSSTVERAPHPHARAPTSQAGGGETLTVARHGRMPGGVRVARQARDADDLDRSAKRDRRRRLRARRLRFR